MAIILFKYLPLMALALREECRALFFEAERLNALFPADDA